MAGLDEYFVKLSHGSVHKKEAMKYEALRLSSFAQAAALYSQSSLEFARVGFFHTGPGDAVECFSCGVKVTEWSPTDQPVTVHVQYSPNCPFVRNNDESGNKPLASRALDLNIFEEVQYVPSFSRSNVATHTPFKCTEESGVETHSAAASVLGRASDVLRETFKREEVKFSDENQQIINTVIFDQI